MNGGVDQLKAKLAFYPPEASYIFEEEPQLGALQMWLIDPETRSKGVLAAAPGFSVFWLLKQDSSSLGSSTLAPSSLPAYIFEVPQARYTVLYSHSNGTDIGHMHELCRRLATVLHVNVMAYEYTGYGCDSSTRRPSEPETYSDIRAALRFLVDTKAIPLHKIILYGQSIGSGPTIDLAAETSGLGGVVVHSGITSGMRVIQPSVTITSYFDIFPNIDKIGRVQCPVLFIHGVSDGEVPIEHGIELHRGCPEAVSPLWIDGCGHNDIETVGRRAYIDKLEEFLKHLEAKG